MANCVSWAPRLTLLDLMNKLDLWSQSWNRTLSYVGDLGYLVECIHLLCLNPHYLLKLKFFSKRLSKGFGRVILKFKSSILNEAFTLKSEITFFFFPASSFLHSGCYSLGQSPQMRRPWEPQRQCVCCWGGGGSPWAVHISWLLLPRIPRITVFMCVKYICLLYVKTVKYEQRQRLD